MGKPSARARATKLRRRPRSSSPVKSGRSPRAPTHAPSMEAIFGGNVLITPGAAPTSQGLHTRNASSLRRHNQSGRPSNQSGRSNTQHGGGRPHTNTPPSSYYNMGDPSEEIVRQKEFLQQEGERQQAPQNSTANSYLNSHFQQAVDQECKRRNAPRKPTETALAFWNRQHGVGGY